MRRTRSTFPTLVALLAGAALGVGLAACGESDPEAELREASERLEERRGAVEQARAELEQRATALEEVETEFEKRLEEARASHDRARKALRDAEQRLAAAKAEVDEQASDDVLFRTVQRTLLEDESLEGVAIAAQVRDRIVTLQGEVQDAAQRERAIELARETAGVDGVKSRIEVRADAATGKAPATKGPTPKAPAAPKAPPAPKPAVP